MSRFFFLKYGRQSSVNQSGKLAPDPVPVIHKYRLKINVPRLSNVYDKSYQTSYILTSINLTNVTMTLTHALTGKNP